MEPSSLANVQNKDGATMALHHVNVLSPTCAGMDLCLPMKIEILESDGRLTQAKKDKDGNGKTQHRGLFLSGSRISVVGALQ